MGASMNDRLEAILDDVKRYDRASTSNYRWGVGALAAALICRALEFPDAEKVLYVGMVICAMAGAIDAINAHISRTAYQLGWAMEMYFVGTGDTFVKGTDMLVDLIKERCPKPPSSSAWS